MCKPKERFIVTSIMILVTLLITSNVFAAQRRLYENFDDRAIDPLLTTRIYGVFNITQPTFSFGTGHGGSGYSFGSGTTNATWLEWNFGNTWYTDELYVSFWMRYPTFTKNYSNENIKFFYPQFGTSNSDKVEYLLYNGSSSALFCGYNNNTYLSNNYMTCTGQADGNWHRYEFYIKFSTGTHKFWYDRPAGNYTDGAYLKNSVNYGSGVWDNHVNLITIGSIDGEQASTFTRFFDDVEVWDGMPDGSTTPPLADTTPPARPSGVITTIIP